MMSSMWSAGWTHLRPRQSSEGSSKWVLKHTSGLISRLHITNLRFLWKQFPVPLTDSYLINSSLASFITMFWPHQYKIIHTLAYLINLKIDLFNVEYDFIFFFLISVFSLNTTYIPFCHPGDLSVINSNTLSTNFKWSLYHVLLWFLLQEGCWLNVSPATHWELLTASFQLTVRSFASNTPAPQ